MSDTEMIHLVLSEMKSIKENQEKFSDKISSIDENLTKKMAAIDDKLSNKFDKQSGRLSGWIAIALTFFVLLIGASFVYSSRIEDFVKSNEGRLDKLEVDNQDFKSDMRTVSGTLKEEHPESRVIEDMHERYNTYRGPKDSVNLSNNILK